MKYLFAILILLNLNLFSEEYVFTIKAKKIYPTQTLETESSQTQAHDFHELNSSLGLSTYQSGSFSGVSSIRHRGLPQGSTQVLFEGMDIKDPASINQGTQLQHFNLSSFGEIDFIKSSLSSVNGSHSNGGLLNMKLRKENLASISYGSRNTLNSHLSFYDTKSGKYLLSFNYFRTDGLSQSSLKNPTSTSNKLESDSSEKFQFASIIKESYGDLDFRLKYLGITHHFEVDSNIGDQRDNDNSSHKQNTIGIDFNYKSLKFLAQFNETTYFDSLFKQAYKGKAEKVQLQYDRSLSKFFEFSSGVEWEDLKSDISAGVYNSPVPNSSKNSLAFFALSKIKLKPLTIIPNIRLDKDEVFGENLSYSLNLKSTYKKIDFSLLSSKGFRSPTLFQLYSSYGDPSLKAEKTKSIEASIKLSLTKYQLSFTQYFTHYKNQIDYYTPTNKYFNYQKSKFKGFEIEQSYKFNDIFSMILNYSYSDAKAQGKQLLRIPYHQFFPKIELVLEKWRFNLSGQYKADRKDFSQTTLPSYFLAHFNLTYELSKKQNVELMLHNLFDHKYEEVENYKTRGLSIYAKTSFKF